jgi:hypothetical protein
LAVIATVGQRHLPPVRTATVKVPPISVDPADPQLFRFKAEFVPENVVNRVVGSDQTRPSGRLAFNPCWVRATELIAEMTVDISSTLHYLTCMLIA